MAYRSMAITILIKQAKISNKWICQYIKKRLCYCVAYTYYIYVVIHNEWGYSNKVLELIKHMSKVDNA